MDTLEINKVVGGILTALLAVTVIGHVGDILVPSREAPEHAAVQEGVPAGERPAEGEPEEPADESAIPLLASADPSAGERAVRVCATCHSFEQGGPDKVGPNLWNVVGANKAHEQGFNYSSAMKEAGGKWTYEDLDAFLADPRGFIQGTKMTFAGVKNAERRADIIVYLSTLGQSPPLPKPEPQAEPAQEGAPPEQQAQQQQGQGQQQQQQAAKPEQPEQGARQPAPEGGAGAVALLASADAEAGKRVARKCAACHTFEQGGANKVGPNLWGIVGADKAHRDDYNYSSAMKEAEGEWTYEDLDAYLANPRQVVKGTKMAFAGVKKDEERADLIAYLRTLSDSPKPLP